MKMFGLVAAAVLAGAVIAASAEDAPKKRGVMAAQRAGWMLGMYIGEGTGPYPFVLQVDPKSEAKAKGVRSGDELIRFEDRETVPLARFFESVNKLRPGKEVTFWVRRGVQTLRFQIRVPKEPGPADEAEEKADKPTDGEPGDAAADDKKKKKKKGPIVIKPIPAPEK